MSIVELIRRGGVEDLLGGSYAALKFRRVWDGRLGRDSGVEDTAAVHVHVDTGEGRRVRNFLNDNLKGAYGNIK